MKRNRQQKYRIKIIQELHLKKDEQIKLDKFVKEGVLSYSDVYFYKNNPIHIKRFYILRKTTNNVKDRMNRMMYRQMPLYSKMVMMFDQLNYLREELEKCFM